MKKGFLVLDYETRSECDLKKAGAWEYSCHQTTKLFCVSWAFAENKEDLKGAPIKSWSPVTGGPLTEFFIHLNTPGVTCVAHNALFEQSITKNCLSRILKRPELKNIPPERWACTASMAAALALPRSLEGACSALGLSVQKDTEGRRLILKYTKPRLATKNNQSKWHAKLSELKRIIEYCEHDIRAEVELFLSIPELSPDEREVWLLDQKMNMRGFSVDRELVQTALKFIAVEEKRILESVKEITDSVVLSPKQRDASLYWLHSKGVVLENLQAKTVEDFLKSPPSDTPQIAIEFLKLRQAASKTSTAKYEAFWARSVSDGRCRDNLMYHGASTGRWSGVGVQIQNLPRNTIKQKDIEGILEIMHGKK